MSPPRAVPALAGDGSPGAVPEAADAERLASDQGCSLRCLLLGRLLLGFLAVLDDVSLGEEDALRDLAPQGGMPEKELEVHREVLELLALRVAHDRPGLAVGLYGEPLLVPADRLRLLLERCAEAGEGPGFCRQLIRRLVVLVGRHSLHPFRPGVCRDSIPDPSSFEPLRQRVDRAG